MTVGSTVVRGIRLDSHGPFLEIISQLVLPLTYQYNKETTGNRQKKERPPGCICETSMS